MATYDAAKDDGSYKLKSRLSLDKIMGATNLCDLLDPEDIKYIGSTCYEGYEADVQSRRDWELRQAEANKLALQVFEAKTFPWPNASSVKFPLITVAALQFQARAYPALVNANDLVKCRVIGEDPKGEKSDRAKRIAAHMTWQCMEQDKSWEEEHDRMLLVCPIAGTAFKKKVFEPGPGHNITMLVLPDNLVVNYFTRDLDSSQRYTHRFYLNANNIRQREMDGRFRELKAEPEERQDNEITVATDEAQGLAKPPQDNVTPYWTGEQYCWWDLDDDGYEEPYIVTIDLNTQEVRRIVARFLPSGIRVRGKEGVPSKWTEDTKDDVYKITPVQIFTKYGFIPSPDGGFYDIGFGTLLGPINETVNTVINQTLDQATMATLGGGFLGRGFKSKGGPITFEPNQWYPVDAPGDDLRKNILPLPIREPSAVLFQLLGLLLQYSERIVSANDMQVGENVGQNTPAETARTMNENGSRVYNAIYKRMWRSERDEFRIQYALNEIYIEHDEQFEDLSSGKGALIRPDDYTSGSSLDVRPAADPHIVSDTARVDQAKIILANSQSIAGHNRYESLLRFYKALNVPDIEKILPHPTQPGPPGADGKPGEPVPIPDFPPAPNPKMMEIQVKQGLLDLKKQEFQSEQMAQKVEMQQELIESQARVSKMQAEVMEILSSVDHKDRELDIKMIYASIEAQGKHQESINKFIDILDRGIERAHKYADISGPSESTGSAAGGGGLSPMAANPGGGVAPPMAAPKSRQPMPQLGGGALQ